MADLSFFVSHVSTGGAVSVDLAPMPRCRTEAEADALAQGIVCMEVINDRAVQVARFQDHESLVGGGPDAR